MIRALLLLLRPKLSIFNGVAAAGGCLLFPGIPETRLILTAFFGVALLTAGGSALNQVIEKHTDGLMMRTRLRPLPQGQLSATSAALIGIAVIMTGLFNIGIVGGKLPVVLGIVALIWYLFIYTPLKRRSPFAVALGGICGSIPPVIGWILAGGSPTDFRIVMLAGLLYLWQVPHFWLLLKRYEDDYSIIGIKLPGGPQLWNAYLCLWIIALSTATILLPVFGLIEGRISFWLLLFSLAVILMSMMRAEKALFHCFNLFPVLLSIMLCFQKYV